MGYKCRPWTTILARVGFSSFGNSTFYCGFIFSFEFNIYKRHTFWSVVIGGTLHFLQANGTSQIMVQRFQSLPDRKACYKYVALYFRILVDMDFLLINIDFLLIFLFQSLMGFHVLTCTHFYNFYLFRSNYFR